MSFWTSRDTEPDWDFVFVEAHTPGQDNWTTLPDLNGHTGTSMGESCGEGWQELHPFLAHYQTDNGDGTCTATGTTGTWNAASGTSGGWEQWRVNLAPYAGGQVELHIAYVSDWSVQGLGVFLDDIEVSTGEGTTSFEDAGMGGWMVTGPAPGSGPNPNNFERITAAGFPEAAIVTSAPTDAVYRTLYMGFGLEGVSTPQARNALIDRAMNYLLQ
jgi:Immune inhibitor A-like, MAM domain